jgi:IS5 family transposase
MPKLCGAKFQAQTSVLRWPVNALLFQRRLLLKNGTVVDATLIAAASSTKNKDHKRDPEMHPSNKGEQMDFGMKGHK